MGENLAVATSKSMSRISKNKPARMLHFCRYLSKFAGSARWCGLNRLEHVVNGGNDLR